MKKRFIFSAALLLTTFGAFAQGDGSAGITEATQMVTGYFDPATKLIYAVGAIIGLIGGVKVYSKFSSGDPDTSKDSGELVRRLYLPDCIGNSSSFFLPLIQCAYGRVFYQ